MQALHSWAEKHRALIVGLGVALVASFLLVLGAIAVEREKAHEVARLAALKETDYATYMNELKRTDRQAWMRELIKTDYSAYLVAFAEQERARAPTSKPAKPAKAKKSTPPAAGPYRCDNVGLTLPRIGAERFVRAQLKNPRGAKFSGHYDTATIEDAETCVFMVAGWVEATNSFNAVIRSDYVVIIERAGGDWILRDMAID